MPVLSCGIMFMGDRGLFLHRHVKVADLQNHFWGCCLLTTVIVFSSSFFFCFCLPIATKLLLPQSNTGEVLLSITVL